VLKFYTEEDEEIGTLEIKINRLTKGNEKENEEEEKTEAPFVPS